MIKALYIGDNKEEKDFFRKLFHSHYPKVELVFVSSKDEGHMLFAADDDIWFTLIDVSMRYESPTDIFELFSKTKALRPILFIGTESFIRSRVPNNIYQINEANGLIKKPLVLGQFRFAVENAIKFVEEQIFLNSLTDVDPKDYLPMKIRNFYRFQKIPYDGFLAINETRFAKVISKNEDFNSGLISRFANKGHKFIYLKKEENLQFLEIAADTLIKVFSNFDAPLDTVFVAQIRACNTIHEYIRNVGVSQKIIDLAGRIILGTSSLYQKIGNIESLFALFPVESFDVGEVSILTGYVCEALLEKVGWNSELSKRKLGLASLLHDCHIVNEDFLMFDHLSDPNLLAFSRQEIESFRSHPLKATEVAQLFSTFSDTEFIIAQHHELPLAKGFPSKMTSTQLTSLSCLFILANKFVLEVIRLKRRANRRDLEAIVSGLSEIYIDGNFRIPIKALQELLES